MSTRQEPPIDLAIKQSSRELRRLSELYRARGKNVEAQKIDDEIERLDKRAAHNNKSLQTLPESGAAHTQ